MTINGVPLFYIFVSAGKLAHWKLANKLTNATMATLPTSLRRTMFVLLGFTTFIIVMVFYWNQNASHSSPSMSLMNTFFIPVDRHTWVFCASCALRSIKNAFSFQFQSTGEVVDIQMWHRSLCSRPLHAGPETCALYELCNDMRQFKYLAKANNQSVCQ